MLLVNNGIAKNTNRYHIDKAPVFKIADRLFYWINRSGQSDYFKKINFFSSCPQQAKSGQSDYFKKLNCPFYPGWAKKWLLLKVRYDGQLESAA